MSRLALRLAVVAVLVFLISPIVLIIAVSFSSATYLTFPPPSLSLRWYRAYFGSPDWLNATSLSLSVGGAVVMLATALGTLTALGLSRLSGRAHNAVTALILSPMIVPGIVAAIGIYQAFAHYGLIGTPIGLVLAHTCLAVPFVVTSVGASLSGLDKRLEQAARGLGATPWGAFRQVTLPLIRPGVLVGALFAFITSFDELIIALFLSGSGAVTLPRRMWDDLRFAIDPTIAAISTLTIALTVLLLGLAQILRSRTLQTMSRASGASRSAAQESHAKASSAIV